MYVNFFYMYFIYNFYDTFFNILYIIIVCYNRVIKKNYLYVI